MHVLFIQKQAFPYMGVMSIAGYLKKHGHSSSCLIDNFEPAHTQGSDLRRADIIGISALSSEHPWLIDVIRRIRTIVPDTPIIIGGIHAILYPDILHETDADMLCAGEGENVLTRVLDMIGHNRFPLDMGTIDGLVYKKEDALCKNRLPALVQQFDWHEDRSVYYKRYTALARDDQQQFISGRGCPYKCNFCYNAQLQEKYRGCGRYIRKKPVELCIEEIENVKCNYGVRSVVFADDAFAVDPAWLAAFLAEYRKRISIPFMCVVRADHITGEIARELSRSGCHTISMGVETGNEHLRNAILNKNISNESLRRAARYFKENNIRIQTSNMFGIPYETLDDALETVRFNIDLGATFTFAAMLMPFPGTGIEKVALESGWLDTPLRFDMLPQSFFSGSVFKGPHIDLLENVKSVIQWCIRYPTLYRFFKRMVRLRCRPLFRTLDRIGIFYRYKEERRLSTMGALQMFWRFRKSQ